MRRLWDRFNHVPLTERIHRALCWVLGHSWIKAHAEPVIGPFAVCRRCGKWSRL